MKLLAHIDHCWLWNHWWKLSHCQPKIITQFYDRRWNHQRTWGYCRLRNSWQKLSCCWSRNRQHNLVLQLMLKSSVHIFYCSYRNCWRHNACLHKILVSSLMMEKVKIQSNENWCSWHAYQPGTISISILPPEHGMCWAVTSTVPLASLIT
jgi:hypothetical protein